jgi:glycerol-3-phosphate acyltransferase PlsY
MGLIIGIVCLAGIAYLLGSIPWGLIFARLFKAGDILKSGSGNIGANNVRRVAGMVPAIFTLILDAAKGGIPVYLAKTIVATDGAASPWVLSLIALSAFIGHLYPIYMGFRNGGKGVATAAGCFVVISPVATGAAILVYILLVYISHRSSVGSLAAAAALPFFVQAANNSMILTSCAILTCFLIIVRHKDNIRRLINGSEPPI